MCVRAALTQSEGELVKALQLGHQGADGVPGLLLEGQVARVLDRLQTREEAQMLACRNAPKCSIDTALQPSTTQRAESEDVL